MQRLDLRITDLGAKRAWLETLDALLRDAAVIGAARWDLRTTRFELDLRRAAYGPSLVTHGRPWVPCRLAVAPVLSVIDGSGVPWRRSLDEQIESLELRDRREIALVTTAGSTRLRLGEAPQLEIRDIGPPTTTHIVVGPATTIGAPAPAAHCHRIGQLLRARVL